jgi:hypothetical protein
MAGAGHWVGWQGLKIPGKCALDSQKGEKTR